MILSVPVCSTTTHRMWSVFVGTPLMRCVGREWETESCLVLYAWWTGSLTLRPRQTEEWINRSLRTEQMDWLFAFQIAHTHHVSLGSIYCTCVHWSCSCGAAIGLGQLWWHHQDVPGRRRWLVRRLWRPIVLLVPNIIIRLTHTNVWESMGKPCSCTQFIISRIFYYESRKNPYQVRAIPKCFSKL